MEGYCIQRFRQ